MKQLISDGQWSILLELVSNFGCLEFPSEFQFFFLNSLKLDLFLFFLFLFLYEIDSNKPNFIALVGV